jgi:hypothetical protein
VTPSTFFSFTLGLVVMTLLGYFITAHFCRGLFSGWVTWALAPATGAGICSLIGFAFRRPMFTIEFGLLIVFSAAWLLKHGTRAFVPSSLAAWRAPILGLFLAGAMGWALADSIVRIEKTPHGAWDGWAIWNSHARFVYRDGPAWQDGIQTTFHADYPLLQPLMTARSWRYAGTDVPDLGGLFCILFALSGVALLGAALAELRGESIGLLMALVLIGTPLYLVHATDQEADVTLSVFFLSAIALICLYFERAPDRPGILALSGFMAGSAGWTKNEGLLFIVAALALLLFPVLRQPRTALHRAAAFSAGLALPLAAIIFFKVSIAPVNDLIADRQYAEMVDKLMNVDRYLITFGNVLRTSWNFGGWILHPVVPLLAFIALRGVDRQTLRSPGWLSGAGILAIVLAGYCAVYVLTPMDLQWHLSSSLERLLMHFWPSALLLAGLATNPRPMRISQTGRTEDLTAQSQPVRS